MSEVGRPSIMTTETLDKLRYAFDIGCTDREACVHAGIHESTLYKYCNENPEFKEEKEERKEKPILLAKEEVVKGLKGDKDFSLKYLERKKKDEFSLKQEIQSKVEQTTVISFDEAMKLTPEEILKRLNGQ